MIPLSEFLSGLGAGPFPDSEAWEIAAIVRECCQRFRPDLVGELTATPEAGYFTVTSGMTGDRFRVTITEEGPTP